MFKLMTKGCPLYTDFVSSEKLMKTIEFAQKFLIKMLVSFLVPMP